MRWIEAAIPVGGRDIDQLCETLAALSVDGMVIEDEADFRTFLEENHQYWDYVDEDLEQQFAGQSRIKFYLPDDESGRQTLSQIREVLGVVPHQSFLEESDWENNWREYYKPLPVGEKLLVVPEWETPPLEDRVVLRLDPGLIFGTGSHATTRMCLEALEQRITPCARVLDLGCGSGILGIGARVLGGGQVVGCDIDPKAPDVALANARLNGITDADFQIYAGDVLTDAGLRRTLGGNYDLVLANIVADVIAVLAHMVPAFLAPGGCFITSGIIEGRQDELEHCLRQAGFAMVEHRCQEDWHCFVCTMAGQPA